MHLAACCFKHPRSTASYISLQSLTRRCTGRCLASCRRNFMKPLGSPMAGYLCGGPVSKVRPVSEALRPVGEALRLIGEALRQHLPALDGLFVIYGYHLHKMAALLIEVGQHLAGNG